MASASSSTIGLPVARVDGAVKVTGEAKFSADLRLPGMLWGVALRSPYPHATIDRIDVAAAQAAPGVHAVITGRDTGGALFGRSISDIPALARDRTRFVGEPVAAVAAENLQSAQRALDLIDVEYTELPAVFEPLEAMGQDAPLLHPDYRSYRGANLALPDVPNLCSYQRVEHGDLEQGFRDADMIVENTYNTPMQHQGYLEPPTCLVSAEQDGIIRIWSSNKAPFSLRDRLARDLGIPVEQVIVEPTFVGGDFGGKGTQLQVPLAYFLSKASGRPVRMVLGGTEGFTADNPRHPAQITIRTGVKRDGTILARHVRMVFSSGAYAGHKPIPGSQLAVAHYIHGLYRIPNSLFESLIVYTNHVPCGHMRSPGGQQGVFACEVDIDHLAEAIEIDPLEFRLLNIVGDGDPGPEGTPLAHAKLRECLESVRARSRWDQPKPPNVGRGVALAPGKTGEGKSSAIVEVHEDGTATLVTGILEQGSGSHTALMQVVAHELQLPVTALNVVVEGTDSGLWDRGGTASSATHGAGRAAFGAAREALGRMTTRAGKHLGCPPEDVEYIGQVFRDRTRPSVSVTFAEVAQRAARDGQPITGRYHFDNSDKLSVFSYIAEVAEVEVDPETGQARVLRVTAASDIGTVLNPLAATGQIEGGLIMGYGTAMMEEMRLNEGRVETVGLNDYKLPTSADIPPFDNVFIPGGSDGEGPGPYGAKECSELSSNPLPPAIANAIFDAVGVRLKELPLSAERVHRALKDRPATDAS